MTILDSIREFLDDATQYGVVVKKIMLPPEVFIQMLVEEGANKQHNLGWFEGFIHHWNHGEVTIVRCVPPEVIEVDLSDLVD